MTSFKQKTYLFLPSEVGMAHILRCAAIAHELHSRGNKVLMALPKRKKNLLRNFPVEIVEIPQQFINDTDSIVNIDNLHKKENLINNLEIHTQIFNKYKPDALIVDNLFPALFSGRMHSIRVFALFNGQSIPFGCTHPGLTKNSILNAILRITLPILWQAHVRVHIADAVNILSKHGHQGGERAWLNEIHFIVPEPPFYFPLPVHRDNVHHIGNLCWNTFDSPIPSWLDSLKKDGNTVYVSFGGTGFSKEILFAVVDNLLHADYRVVVTTGTICDPSEFPQHPHLFVARMIPSLQISPRVDVTVCHGGYGTMLDSIKSGTPVVAVPFNPDQMLHSLRMQELGCARTQTFFRPIDVYNTLALRWSAIQSMCEKISPLGVVSMVQEVLEDVKTYQRKIAVFNSQYPDLDGAIEASNIIEKNTP